MTDKSLLDRVHSPSDLKEMTDEELTALCGEIRRILVDTVAQNGGHLASNLGVVELTVALHSVFDTPADKIVWDVGHQAYAHKILTGRREQIHTIRRENGLSGFPKRSESRYDCFNTGHSSTSVSAAYGLACADELRKGQHYTIAVIGDGALTGGLAFEGLNNAARSDNRLIVILNDNKMSISQNVGSVARYLSRLRIKPSYLRAKTRMHRLEKLPLLGKPLTRGIRRFKNWLRDEFFGGKNNMFRQLGFCYYGPYDGHDITQLRSALKAAKRKHDPVLLHVCTKKGKGYEFAEKNPKDFHGISSFDIETGETRSSQRGYSDVFGECLCRYAQQDKNICAITAAMSLGTGLSTFSKTYKDRFFDVGIAEEHAVTFAAGLAAGGALPVFAVYSTFLQRSYDQILHDAALQQLHIVLAVDRAGIVGEDGETHQGIYDVAFLNTISGVTVYAPSCFRELEYALHKALYETSGVAVVRYPRGTEGYIPEDFPIGSKPFQTCGNREAPILAVTYGREFSQVCRAQELLRQEDIDICVLKLNTVKPLAAGAVMLAKRFERCYFFEEGIRSGGVGETYGFELYQSGYTGRYTLTAINGCVCQAKTEASLHRLGLDAEMIAVKIKNDLIVGGMAHGGKKKT